MIAPVSEPVTVAIADDHTLMRTALANLLTSRNEYKVSIQAENGKQLLDQIDSHGLPDIILLDISIPVMDGFETMALLKKKYRNPNVVAITTYSDHTAILRMSSLGINGYLFKTFEPEEILITLDFVKRNGRYFSAAVHDKLFQASKNDLYRKIGTIKPKELSFLKYLCTGMTYNEIAAKMYLSHHTVEEYRDALFQKFELKNKAELILFALKYRLVELE